MTYGKALLLGIVQGLTEFLPISSSGHLALSRHLLGMGDIGVTFDLLLHAATLLTVIVYFRSRLVALLFSLWRPESAAERRFIWLLFLATLPIVAVGFLLKDPLERVSEFPMAVSALLVCTGLLLLLPRWFKTLGERDHSPRSALAMGIGQAIAILPGISRSGSTITAGVLCGVRPERAAEFAFLMAIPAILGAIVLKGKDISQLPQADFGPFAVGMAAAFLTGLASVYAVLSLVRRGKFRFFAYYCIALGLVSLAYFGFRG